MRQLKRLVPVAGLGAVLAGWALVSGCGEDLVLEVTVPTSDVRADGTTPAEILVTATQGSAIVEGTVTISSSLGAFEPIEDPSVPPSDYPAEGSLNAGEFRARLYSAQPGEATLNVRFVREMPDGTVVPPVIKKATIRFGSGGAGEIASLEFVSATPNVIQLRGSGGTETSQIVFRAKDKSGGAAPAGLKVKFSLGSELGGASVEPTEAETENGGEVRTVLKAGNALGTVVVKASAGPATAESERITIAGRAPNHRNFTFSCEASSIHNDDGVPMSCTAIVADRNSQQAPNVQVTFMTEGGSVARVKNTDEEGMATVTFLTGDPRPADVSVATSYSMVPGFLQNEEDNFVEPSWNCGTGVCNVRDGLNTIIAVTNGEEAWTDTNQNGVWDEGEDFVDLPEPYVDVNDNGKFDPSHPIEKDLYIDANQNGQWDDANGKWDGATLIWKEFKFVWTGPGYSKSHSGFYDATTNQKLTSGVSIPLHGSVRVKFAMLDNNLNMPSTRDGDSISCSCIGGACEILNGHGGTIAIHNRTHGRRFFELFLGNTNEPGCENDGTCRTVNGTISCVGNFSHSSEGGATQISIEHPVTSRGN